MVLCRTSRWAWGDRGLRGLEMDMLRERKVVRT